MNAAVAYFAQPGILQEIFAHLLAYAALEAIVIPMPTG